MRNKILMTLALLIMAVGGAWAQSSLNVVELEVPAGWENVYTAPTAADLPGFKASTVDEAKAWTGAPAEGKAVLFYAFDGNEPKYILFNGKVGQQGSAVYVKDDIFEQKSNTKFYYTAAPTEWELKPDDTGKKWILAEMPASNIELQVEYYAESNLFLSKEALADKTSIAVKAGDLGVQFGEDGKSANTITEGTEMTVTYNGTKKVLGVKVEKVDLSKAYLKWNADQKKLVAKEIPAEVTTVANADAGVTWSAGTYVVEGEVTINGNILLQGNVDLIIKDGAKLTVNGRINGTTSKYNLSIYGQANQTGQLVVNNSSDAICSITTLEVHSCQVKATASEDNCSGFYNISTFNVYGGSVDSENTGTKGNGIWLASNNSSMNIYGGEVKAVGKGKGNASYGITASSSSTVTVNGGKLWAECAGKKALQSNITLTKGAGFTGKIEYSSDNSTWSETVDANAKYVRAGY